MANTDHSSSQDLSHADGVKPGGEPAPFPAQRPQSGTVEAIIASLCGQVEAAEDKAERWRAEVLLRRQEATAQSERIEALTNALQPFADLACGISGFWSDARNIASLSVEPIKVADLRRAAALIAASKASQPRDTTDRSSEPREDH